MQDDNGSDGGPVKPRANVVRCCANCKHWHRRRYIHCQCSGPWGGDIKGDPRCTFEHEHQPSSEAPINPACMQSFDGRDWASDFRATAKSLGYCDMDEGWLIGWFANAIMRGFDESERRRDAEQERAAQACSPRLNPDGSPHGRRNDDGYCSVHDATMDRCTHGVAAARAEGARAERERWKALLEDERRDWHSLASNWPDDARQLEQIDEVFDEIIRAAQDEHGTKGEA